MSSARFENWHGASVLPFARAENGEIYFLLGKEKEDRSWQSTSNRWCDFGGRRCHYQDKDPFHSAAREFMEEMAGCFFGGGEGANGDLALAYASHQAEGWKKCAQEEFRREFGSSAEFEEAVGREAVLLAEGRYAYLIVRPSKDEIAAEEKRGEGSFSRSYVTIVKPIAFDPWLPKVFDAVVTRLQEVADAARLYAVEYCETMGRPFNKAIYSRMKSRTPVFDGAGRWVGTRTHSCKPYVPRLIWKMLASSDVEREARASDGSCLRCENCLNKTIAKVRYDPRGHYEVLVTSDPPCPLATRGSRFPSVRAAKGSRLAAFEAMTAKRSRLNEKVNALPPGLRSHPALCRCEDPRMPEGEALSFVMVRTEFLEKQKIAWWSLDRLYDVCESADSSYKGEQFRQWAVDVLPIVLPLVEAYCKGEETQ